jgi:hypothetical protein
MALIDGDFSGLNNFLPARKLLLLKGGELRWRVGHHFKADSDNAIMSQYGSATF